MTHERTRFAQEVAQVELWWKVNLNYLSELRHQLIVHARVHALRRSNALHRCGRCIQERGTIQIQHPYNILAKKVWRHFVSSCLV